MKTMKELINTIHKYNQYSSKVHTDHLEEILNLVSDIVYADELFSKSIYTNQTVKLFIRTGARRERMRQGDLTEYDKLSNN